MTSELSTVLVTGGAGYIGSHTCKALAQAGYLPVVYDSLARGHASAVKWGPLEIGDLLDGERLRDVLRKYRPYGVIHFAGLSYVGESMEDPLSYYRNNVGGTMVLLRAMAAECVTRLVFSSSCATYGIPESIPIREDTVQAPINPYGQSKLMVEQLMKDHARVTGLSSVALRYFNAAGADAAGEIGETHDPETHLIPLILGAAQGSAPTVTVFGNDHPTPDGTCIRDYIHVTDLANAHVKSLSQATSNNGFEALNLGTGRGHSILEVIKAAEEITGSKVPYVFGPRRAGDPSTLVADVGRAKARLDWRTQNSDLRNILQTAWNWMDIK